MICHHVQPRGGSGADLQHQGKGEAPDMLGTFGAAVQLLGPDIETPCHASVRTAYQSMDRLSRGKRKAPPCGGAPLLPG